MEDFLKFLLIAGVILVGIFKEVSKNSKSKKATDKRPVPPIPSPTEIEPDAVPMPEAWGRPKSLDELLRPIPVEPPTSKRSSQQASRQTPKQQQQKKKKLYKCQLVPPHWHTCDIKVARLRQRHVTVVPTRWHIRYNSFQFNKKIKTDATPQSITLYWL